MQGVVWIVMGVSGCGKTTVGTLLAEKLKLPFYDADNYHPKENIEKMRKGIPLNDRDRLPWLETLGDSITRWKQSGGAVLACSALKKSYRELLSRGDDDGVRYIHLKGSFEEILLRLNSRKGHYFPASLLRSQLEDLEEPEKAILADASPVPSEIVDRILPLIRRKPGQ